MSMVLFIGALVLISFLLSPRTQTADGFFKGISENGSLPSLWTLVLSQVTTWIFARSLMNAAILGYYYGVGGALTYAAYYLSFLTGGLIIDRIRFEHGYDSIQNFLRDQFGGLGTSTYNIVVAVRLLSEVFANLLVIGVLFGVHAGLLKAEGEALVATLTRLFGEPTMLLFNGALVLSALSTLDSTFSSASKLTIVDMRLAEQRPNNGRIAMALFLIGGLVFLFLGNKDLFAAVAVSGTASMFLAPVVW